MNKFFEALKASGNDPNRLQSYIGTLRGETPGNVPEELRNIPQDELSQYDRFSQFAGEENPIAKYTNLIGAPLVASAYEASKLSPGLMNNVIAPAVDFFNPGRGAEFQMDETTSKPSFKNIGAAARGALYGAFGR